MKKLKKIPRFKSEKAENRFWQTHDSTDYIDYNKAELSYFSNLQPSVKTISLRLPEKLLNSLKILAHKMDVPYQSLMKVFLNEKVMDEFNKLKSFQK